jgi:4-amino-4-deoxy-L-arabinose transferase-like glycosyltransferase
MAALGQKARRRDLLALRLLLLLTFALSGAWAAIVPPPTAPGWGNFHPDEAGHAAVIEYIANHIGRLPPYRFPYDTSVHPPLYHAGAALLLALLRPVTGPESAYIFLRLATALSGVGVVYLTYAAARRLTSRRTALFAGALVALVPMRAALGGALNNENLAALGAAGALAVIVAGLRSRNGFPRPRIGLLALYLVVGIGSKLTCLGLLPVAVGAVLWCGRNRRGPANFLKALALCLAPLAAWGWWFARNQRLYGDPLRKAAADRLWAQFQPGFVTLSTRDGLTAPRYAASLAHIGYLSFWGMFDAFRFTLPAPVYAAIALMQAVALLGLFRTVAAGMWRTPSRRAVAVAFGLYAAFVTAVFYQFNWSHYTPQGRYFFVLLAPFGALTARGLREAIPFRARQPVAVVILCALLLVNLWALVSLPARHARSLVTASHMVP